MSIWTVLGSLLRNWLQDARRLRIFNIGMALLLVVSLYPIIADTGLF
jgi:threonine/homoserine/homoserine lactone efflux protein